MTYKNLAAAALLCSTAIGAPASAATLFTIDLANTSVAVDSNSTACVFGNCRVNANLATLPGSFSLDVGQSATFDFARFVVNRGLGVGTASIDATLAFLTPAGSAGTGGTANYFRFGGVLGGSLVWDDAVQSITAANGASYSVRFNGLSGIQFGSNAISTVTVTLDSLAGVPEPATWGLMILGFGAIGGVMRRRSAATTAVRFA